MSSVISALDRPAAAIEQATRALRAGRLVAVPTETVYGLAANATDPGAIARIYEAKGRPRFNPLIIHVRSSDMAAELVRLGDDGARLAAEFWPGPLTIVATANEPAMVADIAAAGLDTLAVRVPSHPVMQQILEGADLPLAAPSANISGHITATNAADVAADLGDKLSLIVDAGPSNLGLESTIISVDGEPTLLRPGAIDSEAIEAALGKALAVPDGAGIAAPGMMTSHYAPNVRLRMNATEIRPGESVLAFGSELPAGADEAGAIVNLSPAGDLRQAAAGFFAAIRVLEKEGAPIAAATVPERGLGRAINDRLRRASAPRQS